jgi:ATP-binding cassette subfamily F protein 3
VTHRRGLRIGYLGQEVDLDPGLTVRAVVAEAAGDPAALEARLEALEAQMAEAADDDALAAVLDAHAACLARLEAGGGGDARGVEVLAGLRIPEARWDTPVGRLSGGEKTAVALARVLVEGPDLLLLDEPDNHLDDAGKVWLEREVVAHRGAVGLISHDRYLIDRAANRIFELEDGRITPYRANYSAYLAEKRARLAREHQLRELQERELKKLKASAEQLTQWARQNPKFAPRAENQRRKLAEERERLARNAPPPLERRRIGVDFAAARGSTLVLEAKGLAKRYGEREVFRPFDLAIRHGERVGLVGPNGAGKTTLLRMVLGQEAPTAGTLRIGPSIEVGYYAQQQETLDPAMTPLGLVRRLRPMTEQQALSFLVGLLFDRDDALNRIGNLSGGERSRLQIGALILRGANFLLLDEPTNNLDLVSIEVLEEALLGFGGSILTVSHDRYYLTELCDRIVEVDGGTVRDYPGGWAAYDAQRGRGTELTHRPPAPIAPAAPVGRRRR